MATTWYVHPDAPNDDGDGRDLSGTDHWAHAKRHLQAMIDDPAVADGDTIILGPGKHTVDPSKPPEDRLMIDATAHVLHFRGEGVWVSEITSDRHQKDPANSETPPGDQSADRPSRTPTIEVKAGSSFRDLTISYLGFERVIGGSPGSWYDPVRCVTTGNNLSDVTFDNVYILSPANAGIVTDHDGFAVVNDCVFNTGEYAYQGRKLRMNDSFAELDGLYTGTEAATLFTGFHVSRNDIEFEVSRCVLSSNRLDGGEDDTGSQSANAIQNLQDQGSIDVTACTLTADAQYRKKAVTLSIIPTATSMHVDIKKSRLEAHHDPNKPDPSYPINSSSPPFELEVNVASGGTVALDKSASDTDKHDDQDGAGAINITP